MEIVPQAVQYIIFILCVLVSPIEDSFEVYVDGITLSNGDIETLTISHDSAGSALHFGAFDPSGEYAGLFSVDKLDKDAYKVIIDDVTIQVDLKEFLRPGDLEKLREKSGTNFSVDVKGIGKVYIYTSGVVIYLKMEEDSGTILAVHE